jgi:DNA modification methylase
LKQLYYGDNLQVLREHIADESVDLIYLDPPFNSKRDYNLLFKTPKASKKTASKAALTVEEPQAEYGDAQITAFEDTWQWGQQAENEFREILKCGNTDVAELMQALRAFLKENDMMAYLTMMCNRLLELHRVLKPTGSLYLHCDPTASHYLKIVLDGVFGKENYRTEISWRRQSAHNDAKQGRKQYGNVRDSIFFYTKDGEWEWNSQYTAYDESYVEDFYKFVDPESGRRYRLSDMTGPGGAAKGNPSYEVMGVTRYWRYTKERMAKLIEDGRVVQTKPGGVPQQKRYLDEMPGVALQNDWDDILPAGGNEYLGYPTQKPLALLERIISASSNEGDVVLDPFCGCGTAVHAAEKLKRQWIGIDITHLAVSLIEKRMKEAFSYLAGPSTGSGRAVAGFEVIGTPQDLDAARDLAERDKYQFQLWACTLVGAQPYKGGKKGADGGIDGMLWIEVGGAGKGSKTEKVIVQVKGGAQVNRANIATLKGDIDREKAAIGLFITLAEPTKPMIAEAAAAGHWEAPLAFGGQQDFPKIQILTIEGLLNGTERPQFPDLSRGEQTFKKAKKETKKSEQKGLFE